MPHMKCCGKAWSVGSDDFVLSSLVGFVFRVIWVIGLIAFTIVVFTRDCFSGGPQEAIAFTFVFSQIVIQVLVGLSEGAIGFVSSRGTISRPGPVRRLVPHFLRLRAFLYAAEVAGCAFGCYVAWSPYIQDDIDCNRANRVRQAIEGYVISLIVILVLIAILFMVYFDPLGLQTPSLLTELHVSHREGDDDTDGDVVVEVKKVHRKRVGGKTIKCEQEVVGKRLYSTASHKHWQRKVGIICCCTGGNNSRSKISAMEDVAHAMATMFDEVDVVLTDFVAALMLVHHGQRQQIKDGFDIGIQLKNITYEHMDDTQFPPDYKKNVSSREIDFYLPEVRFLMEDIDHYLRFALGIYGWPIHMYLSPVVGTMCLCAHLKCRRWHSRSQDFEDDNHCLCNTAALQLRSQLREDEVIYVSCKNEVHLPPFSLSFDHRKKAVVLAIRGSMSLRDALTDMNMSMKRVLIKEEPYCHLVTMVHAGMYNAASKVRKKVDQKLDEVFDSEQGRNYKFVITGHSLGAGVAAILAVLYRRDYPNQHLHCYAFSPPGSLFTLPLAEYSKQFITTIVYGNDIVPRLTFRGLLYLKRNMTHLVDSCEIPKHAILCPLFFSCCYRKPHNQNQRTFKGADLYNHSTEEGIFKTPVDDDHGQLLQQHTPKRNEFANITESMQAAKKIGKLWRARAKESSLHKFVEKMYTVEQAPAFVPGRVLHITDTGKKIRRRFWNIFGEKEVRAVWRANEDFCYIVVENGMFDHHLPDHVLGAVNRLIRQKASGKGTLPDLDMDRVRKQSMDQVVGRAKTVATMGTPKKLPLRAVKSEAPFLRQASQPICTISDSTQCLDDIGRVDDVTVQIPNDDDDMVARIGTVKSSNHHQTVEVTVHLMSHESSDEETAV